MALLLARARERLPPSGPPQDAESRHFGRMSPPQRVTSAQTASLGGISAPSSSVPVEFAWCAGRSRPDVATSAGAARARRGRGAGAARA
ncbi:hypothetical protein, partial [Cryobacterium sp. TMT4-10]|uniref:hypothetical protein n=1 Tax=Cryobacterium sp. TMT4-10 TaxID=1259256 RepID=UPI001A7E0A82